MKDTILQIAIESAKGNMPDEQANQLLQMANGKAGMFKSESALNVLDIDGNPLIVGKRYKFREKVILITKEQYGQGNIADTYYSVFYLHGKRLEEGRTVVDGKGGPFSGFTYQSMFKKLNK